MQKIKYFTQKELAKLFKVIKRSGTNYCLRDYCIFRVAYRCGLRASEVGLVTLADYNRQAGELYCKRLKSSQNNTIRLDDETIKALNKYIRESQVKDILFISQAKKPISRQMLDCLIRRYCRAARISDRGFHVLKHSIAVHLAESGLDIKELQHYLGHKNVNSTIIYFQFTTKQQDEMYKKLRNNEALV